MGKDIVSMLPDELAADFARLGLPKFRASQVFDWLGKGIRDYSAAYNEAYPKYSYVYWTLQGVKGKLSFAKNKAQG